MSLTLPSSQNSHHLYPRVYRRGLLACFTGTLNNVQNWSQHLPPKHTGYLGQWHIFVQSWNLGLRFSLYAMYYSQLTNVSLLRLTAHHLICYLLSHISDLLKHSDFSSEILQRASGLQFLWLVCRIISYVKLLKAGAKSRIHNPNY